MSLSMLCLAIACAATSIAFCYISSLMSAFLIIDYCGGYIIKINYYLNILFSNTLTRFYISEFYLRFSNCFLR